MNILEIAMRLHQTKHNQYSNAKINAATTSRRSVLKVKQVTEFKLWKWIIHLIIVNQQQ